MVSMGNHLALLLDFLYTYALPLSFMDASNSISFSRNDCSKSIGQVYLYSNGKVETHNKISNDNVTVSFFAH